MASYASNVLAWGKSPPWVEGASPQGVLRLDRPSTVAMGLHDTAMAMGVEKMS